MNAASGVPMDLSMSRNMLTSSPQWRRPGARRPGDSGRPPSLRRLLLPAPTPANLPAPATGPAAQLRRLGGSAAYRDWSENSAPLRRSPADAAVRRNEVGPRRGVRRGQRRCAAALPMSGRSTWSGWTAFGSIGPSSPRSSANCAGHRVRHDRGEEAGLGRDESSFRQHAQTVGGQAGGGVDHLSADTGAARTTFRSGGRVPADWRHPEGPDRPSI